MLQSSEDADIEIYVRERIPAGQDPSEIKEAVLFVHGATYPGHTFDTALESGPNWMEYTADAGFATYYMDKRGYGNSTRPDAMAAPPDENEPFARAETVIHDIDDIVEFILDCTDAETVHLVGWSWGTVTTGMYTASNNDKVGRLVLFAPV
jgi:pimeloyl-ACP methyl ester carboxylesterase